jgi:hypothetical protein
MTDVVWTIATIFAVGLAYHTGYNSGHAQGKAGGSHDYATGQELLDEDRRDKFRRDELARQLRDWNENAPPELLEALVALMAEVRTWRQFSASDDILAKAQTVIDKASRRPH